ncbi:putative HTH-type transcriptional regulator [uncultured archaeon]|nr:putative HTH-type transcriptional regulator [uncultured archaeon]
MDIEIRLLKLLEEDATTPTKDLASMLGAKEAAVAAAVKKLRDSGVVTGQKAVINWKKAGAPYASAVIQVKVVPQAKDGFAKICKDIAKNRIVEDVLVVSGEYDLMLTVRAESIQDISDFVTEVLAPKKEVVGTNTHIVLSEFKRRGVSFTDETGKRLPVSI